MSGLCSVGVVVGSQKRMVLFSTPYRSQRLYVRIGSKHHFKYDGLNNNNTSNTSNQQPVSEKQQQVYPTAHHNSNSDTQRRLFEGVSFQANYDRNSEDGTTTVASIKHSNSVQRTMRTYLSGDANMLELQAHLLPFREQTLTQEYSSKLVRRLLLQHGELYQENKKRKKTRHGVTRSLLSGAAATSAATAGPVRVGEGLHKISDHEVLLTGLTDFGFLSVLLADQPLTSHKPTTPNNTTAQNKTAADGEFLVSIAIGETVLPGKFKALQSTALPPSLRLIPPAAVQWGNTSSTPSSVATPSPPAGGSTAAQECQYLGQLQVATKHSSSSSSSSVGPVPDLSADASGGTVVAVGDETSPVTAAHGKNKSTSARHARLEPVVSLNGELSSGACGKTISFEANAFSLEVFNASHIAISMDCQLIGFLTYVHRFI